MTLTTPVTEHLDQLNLPYQLFTHPGPVTSLEQAASERGQTADQVVRSLLFRLPSHEFVMVLVAGPAQIPWKILRKTVGESRITTASAAELLEVTGYQKGAVSPFGVKKPIRVLIDRAILAQESVSIGSGVRGTTVILKTADLLKGLPTAETLSLTEEHF